MGNHMIVSCVGDAFVDIIAQVPVLPPRGEAVWCFPTHRFGGGTSANVASGLAKLGIPVSFHGRVGNDEYGDFLVDDLDSQGIDTTGVVKDPEAPTGLVFAMVEPDGERSLVVCALGTAYTQINGKDLHSVDVLSPKAIYITGVILVEEPSRSALYGLVKRHKGNTRIYFDPNVRHPGNRVPADLMKAMREISEMSDVVLAGEGEIEALGLSPVDKQLFVVKCGVRGARIDSPSGTIAQVDAYKVDAIDAIGAGDAFDAAFIAAHYEGLCDEDALEFANAAAALSVTKQGARAMPSLDDAMRLWRE